MRYASFPRLVLVLTITLLFAVDLVPQVISPAHAADATLVFAAYQAIMTYHVKRRDPIKLLTGALQGLRQALASVGIAERLADLGAADEATARSEFQARFDRAVRLGQRKLTVTQLQYGAATAMAASVGGCCTSFSTPEQWNGNFVGVGSWDFYKFGRLVTFYVVPYSPATNAGLRPFDRVIAVDGQSVQGIFGKGMSQGMRWQDIDDHIAGPEGTTVRLTILRPGQSAPLTLSIVRQRIQRFTGVWHKKLDGDVGYIWIRSLGRPDDPAEFRRALVELQRGGMRGLILDLRFSRSSSGYLRVLLVANTLLPAGVPIQTIVPHVTDVGTRVRPEACPKLIQGQPWSPGNAGTYLLPSPCTMTTEGGTLLDPSTPLVVLIDEETHHFGETLSTAIRAARRGKLLGVRTAGQTGVGPSLDLPGGAGIDVERYIVLAGNGTVLDKVGVQPDVPVELTASDLDHGVDSQLQRAVQMLPR